MPGEFREAGITHSYVVVVFSCSSSSSPHPVLQPVRVSVFSTHSSRTSVPFQRPLQQDPSTASEVGVCVCASLCVCMLVCVYVRYRPPHHHRGALIHAGITDALAHMRDTSQFAGPFPFLSFF